MKRFVFYLFFYYNKLKKYKSLRGPSYFNIYIFILYIYIGISGVMVIVRNGYGN